MEVRSLLGAHSFMYKTDSILVEKCRTLRRKGVTLGEIVKTTNLPKTTIFDHVRDISLPLEVKERLVKENIQRLKEIAHKRKGRCIPGRIVIKPEGWTNELIFLVAHFMFDGEIQSHSCIYHNRNKALINKVSSLMKKIFNLKHRSWFNKETGVRRISYHYVELADYMRRKTRELKKYIMKESLSLEKKIFLQAFFDDEGSVCFEKKRNKKRVRGYQHNLEILKTVQNLLKDFNIESKIDEKYQEIIVSRKPNIIKFRDKINFSKGVYINPNRKNSVWKQKLEKREILNKIIDSYQK